VLKVNNPAVHYNGDTAFFQKGMKNIYHITQAVASIFTLKTFFSSTLILAPRRMSQ